jgi:hypothetical protein
VECGRKAVRLRVRKGRMCVDIRCGNGLGGKLSDCHGEDNQQGRPPEEGRISSTLLLIG